MGEKLSIGLAAAHRLLSHGVLRHGDSDKRIDTYKIRQSQNLYEKRNLKDRTHYQPLTSHILRMETPSSLRYNPANNVTTRKGLTVLLLKL